MIEHQLKTWPGPFSSVLMGTKLHEVRKADRPFEAGDLLVLREWLPCKCTGGLKICDRPRCDGTDGSGYTGREIRACVTYITRGGEWGVPADLCILSIRVISHNVPEKTLPEPIRIPRGPAPCPWCARLGGPCDVHEAREP